MTNNKKIECEATRANTPPQPPRNNGPLLVGVTLILSGVAGLAISRNYRIPSAATIGLGTASLLWGIKQRRVDPRNFKKSEDEFKARVRDFPVSTLFTAAGQKAALQSRWKDLSFAKIAQNESPVLLYHYPLNPSRLKSLIEAQMSLEGLFWLYSLPTPIHQKPVELVGADFAPLQALVGKFYNANAETATNPKKYYRLIKEWNLKASPEVEEALAQAREARTQLGKAAVVPKADEELTQALEKVEIAKNLQSRLDSVNKELKARGVSTDEKRPETKSAQVQMLLTRHKNLTNNLNRMPRELSSEMQQRHAEHKQRVLEAEQAHKTAHQNIVDSFKAKVEQIAAQITGKPFTVADWINAK